MELGQLYSSLFPRWAPPWHDGLGLGARLGQGTDGTCHSQGHAMGSSTAWKFGH